MSENYDRLVRLGVPDSVPAGPINFVHLFDEFVASTPKVWGHDRSQSVGASEAFSCIRKTWFSKRGHLFGYKKDADHTEDWGAVRRGDLIENYHAVPALEAGFKRRGMELIMAGEGQDTIVRGTTSATLDGLVINAPRDALAEYGVDDIETDCFVLEMKSFDPRIAIAEEKAVHRGQATMQLGLIRETTNYKPVYAIILYIQCSWIDDIRPFPVKWDPNVYDIGKRRNERVFETEDPSVLGPEGKIVGLCNYCEFRDACAEVTTGRVPEKRSALGVKAVDKQNPELLDELNEMVLSASRLSQQKKKVEAELAEANEGIKQCLIAHRTSRAVGDGWKVSYTAVPGRGTLKKNLMIAAGLDPDEYIEAGPGYDKLTVTVA